jgi:hypothetical protein
LKANPDRSLADLLKPEIGGEIMAFRNLQVNTVICDNCKKEVHRVTTDADEFVYPEYMEWDLYIAKLEKEGWVFEDRELDDGGEVEIECCSRKCFDEFVGQGAEVKK